MLAFSLYDRIWSKYLFCLTELLHPFLSLDQLLTFHSLFLDLNIIYLEEFFNVSFFVSSFFFYHRPFLWDIVILLFTTTFQFYFQSLFVCFFAALSSLLASSLFQGSSFVKSHASLSLDDKDTTSLCTLLSVHELSNRCTVSHR